MTIATMLASGWSSTQSTAGSVAARGAGYGPPGVAPVGGGSLMHNVPHDPHAVELVAVRR